MPFVKGQSGNVNGGASQREWRNAIRMALSAKGDWRLNLRKVADVLIDSAMEGDLQAIKEIGDRLDGKPTQSIAGDEERPPIKIHHTKEEADTILSEFFKTHFRE